MAVESASDDSLYIAANFYGTFNGIGGDDFSTSGAAEDYDFFVTNAAGASFLSFSDWERNSKSDKGERAYGMDVRGDRVAMTS